jgi:hypothetical protein
MRRRSSSSDEDLNHPTPEVLPATPTHGDKRTERRRGIEKDVHDGTHKKERRKEDAAGQWPSEKTQFLTTTTNTTTMASGVPSPQSEKDAFAMHPPAKDITPDSMVECHSKRRSRLRNPWACSVFTVVTTLLGFGLLALMMYSFTTRQLDTKGCEMCYMRPAFVKFTDFDTEHTRFASKYSLYLYREGGIDDDVKVGTTANQ